MQNIRSFIDKQMRLDSEQTAEFLSNYYDNWESLLEDLQTAVKSLYSDNNQKKFADLNPLAAEKLMREHLFKPFDKLFTSLGPAIKKTMLEAEHATTKVMNYTAQPKFSNEIEAADYRARLIEIRSLMRNIVSKKEGDTNISAEQVKRDMVMNALEKNDKSFLHAVMSSPLQLLVPETVIELRRSYTRKHAIEVIHEEETAKSIANQTRNRATEISVFASTMLMKQKMTVVVREGENTKNADINLEIPVRRIDYWSVFSPRNDSEHKRSIEEIELECIRDEIEIDKQGFRNKRKSVNLNVDNNPIARLAEGHRQEAAKRADANS